MLGQPERLNEDYLKSWIALDWANRYTGDGQSQRELSEHLDRLLASGIGKSSLNEQTHCISARRAR